jgi:hypothetical protein
MSISTYFRPNIHQNGPKILGARLLSIANPKQDYVCLLLMYHPKSKLQPLQMPENNVILNFGSMTSLTISTLVKFGDFVL